MDPIHKKINGRTVTMNLKQLDSLLNQTCSCKNYQYQRGRDTRGLCLRTGQFIIKYLKLGFDIDSTYLNSYLKKIFYNASFYRSCLIRDSTMKTVIKNILRKHIPPTTILTKIVNFTNSNFLDLISELLKNPEFTGFEEEFVVSMINKQLMNCPNEDLCVRHTNVFKIIVDNTEMTPGLFELLFKCRCHAVKGWLHDNLQKVDDGMYTQQCLYNSCKLLPDSVETVLFLVEQKNNKIDELCLAITCEFCSTDAIQFILNYKITVQKDHFQRIIHSKQYRVQQRYWRKPPKGVYCFGGYTPEKFELLVKFGYWPDQDDLIFSIKNRKILPNIERFNFVLDNSVHKVCQEVKFFPNYPFNLEDDKLCELQKLCTRPTHTKIENYLKLNKIKPDSRCMGNAAKIGFYNNGKTIDVLLKYGTDIKYPMLRKMVEKYKTYVPWRYRYRRRNRGRKQVEQIPFTDILDHYNNIQQNRMQYLEHILKENGVLFDDYDTWLNNNKIKYGDILPDEKVESNINKKVVTNNDVYGDRFKDFDKEMLKFKELSRPKEESDDMPIKKKDIYGDQFEEFKTRVKEVEKDYVNDKIDELTYDMVYGLDDLGDFGDFGDFGEKLQPQDFSVDSLDEEDIIVV